MHAVYIDQQTEIGGRADGHDDVPRNPDSSSRKIQNDVHLFHIRTISKLFPSCGRLDLAVLSRPLLLLLLCFQNPRLYAVLAHSLQGNSSNLPAVPVVFT
jgi:hypothetical protein